MKCPNCRENIDSLTAYSEIVQTMELEGDEVVFNGMDYIEGYTNFECPECNETLFKKESDAVNFLKGK